MNKLIVTLLLMVVLPSLAQQAGARDDAQRDASLTARAQLPELPLFEQFSATPELGEGIASEQLGSARGREGSTASADLSGFVSGNSASDLSTGANTITAGSFANMSGMPVVIQNSGANVLIQNATVINLQLR